MTDSMHSSLHVALAAVGSHGDVHPFVGLGIRLRERGHQVTVITNEHFAPLVRAAGLQFASIGTDEEYRKIAADPDLWNGRKGFEAIARGVIDLIGRVYDQVSRLHAAHDERLVVAASSLAIGARIAQERLGVSLATVHLSPAVFQSVHEMPRLPGVPLPRWSPRWLKRVIWKIANFMVDRALAGPVNAFRGELGLPPVRGIFRDYWHSPQLVLAMFPDWYAAVQPDWPRNTHTVGFPLYDERGVTVLPPLLEAFLAAGDPPIAFTPGSAMFQGQRFFAASADACRQLGRRGLLLSRHREHIPANLPAEVIHVDYAPFSELLPRCAALVHHGGIGTSAQAMAAGCPQVITPFAHDQPDNADRLQRLGIGRTISPRRYSAKRVAQTLETLLATPAIQVNCRTIAARLHQSDGLAKACELLESLPVSARANHKHIAAV
jgi:UDP:flavonoid glycosyltransferase YjiC (YdhE family)